jgi:tetratricopeptide (TPR) repeat protein
VGFNPAAHPSPPCPSPAGGRGGTAQRWVRVGRFVTAGLKPAPFQVNGPWRSLAVFVQALLAVWLALALFPIQAGASQTCPAASGFQALIVRGSDATLRSVDREKAYERAIQLCPDQTETYHSLSALLRVQHDFQAALYWARRGLDKTPGDAQLRLDEATGLVLAGQPGAALELLNRLPRSATTEFYLGMAYRALQQHAAAQQAFYAAAALGYHDAYVFYALIEQDRALHDEAAGLRDFKTLYRRFPNSPWLHLVLGDAYMNRYDDANARAEYDEALRIAPELPVAHFKLGYLAFVQGDYAQAARQFRTEIGLDPGFGEAYLYLGVTLRRQGKIQDSVPLLEQAVKLDSHSALAYSALAGAQRQSNQLSSALETLRTAEMRFPNDATFPAQRAALLRESGRTREAEREAARSESLSRQANPLRSSAMDKSATAATTSASAAESGRPGTVYRATPAMQTSTTNPALRERETEALAAISIHGPPARRLILEGKTYLTFGDPIPAIQSFLEAAKLEPSSAEPLYYLGTAFFFIGERSKSPSAYEHSEQNFKSALELSPSYDRAEFMLGAIAAIQSRLPEAQKYLAQAVQMNPSNPYYHLHYGILLRHLGNDVAAIKELRAAEALNPQYALTHLELGSIDEQAENYAEARRQLEYAVKLNPNLPVAYYHLAVVYSHLGMAADSKAAYAKFRAEKAQQEDEPSTVIASAEQWGSDRRHQ